MAGPNKEESIERWADFESGIIVSNGDTLPFYYTFLCCKITIFYLQGYNFKGEAAAIAHPNNSRCCAVPAFSSYPDSNDFFYFIDAEEAEKVYTISIF